MWSTSSGIESADGIPVADPVFVSGLVSTLLSLAVRGGSFCVVVVSVVGGEREVEEEKKDEEEDEKEVVEENDVD